MPTLMRELLNKLSNVIASHCKGNVSKSLKSESELARQSTRAEYGDICIPRGVVSLAFPTPQQVEAVKNSILNTDASSLPLPVLSCSSCDNGFIAIRLQRPATFKHVISKVLQEAERYGHREAEQETAVITSVAQDNIQKEGEGADGTSLAVLRAHLLHQHISALLEASGYTVHHKVHQKRAKSGALSKILGEEKPEHSSATGRTSPSLKTEGVHPAIERALHKSKYVASVACQTDMDVDFESQTSNMSCIDDAQRQSSSSGVKRSSDHASVLPSCSVLDLATVIRDQQLRTGKRAYSKNLSDVQLTNKQREPSGILQECFALQHAVDEVKRKTSSDTIQILHVGPSNQEFMLQQLDVSLRGLSDNFHDLHQSHLPCAPVRVTDSSSSKFSSQSENKMDADSFYTIREAQMREASVLKYGDQVKGDTWNSMIHTLTAAGIKFDILGTQSRHEVKLDVGSSDATNPWRDNRNGVFVVYNYARLSSIFTRFEEEVQNGTYPPLPPVETVEFSVLREEVEWKLLFSHVLTFPDVVAGSVEDGFTSTELCCKFETQKVCRFLITLSQDLSAYYSRFRILMEPRDHLLPTIYARLYLLKAVHQVMVSGLSLLRITPLTQM